METAPAGHGKIDVTVTSLEMLEAPVRDAPPPPPGDVKIIRSQHPSLAFYRFLYNTVGEPWAWWERRVMSDEDLSAIVQDPLVEVHVLYQAGTPAGYFELDRRDMPDIELAYFGLTPDAIGKGLGGYLLGEAVRAAWSYAPLRLWVHTCTLDHPRALGVYQQAGFKPFARKTEIIDDPKNHF